MYKNMLLNSESWLPLFGPETETGTGTETGNTQAPPGGGEGVQEKPSGPGSGRSSLRRDLERGFEDARKATEAQETEKKKGRFASKGPRTEETEETEETETAAGDETLTPEQKEAKAKADAEALAKPKLAAPEGWAKEAKAEWEKVPAPVQAAIAKREQDMAKGVQELQAKYADIDTAIKPYIEAIRKNGHTPASSIAQLFGWMQALKVNPTVAFPALAASFQFDLKKLFANEPAAGQPQNQQAPNQQQQTDEKKVVDELPPAAQQLFASMQQKIEELQTGFGQQITGLQQSLQQSSLAKTKEHVDLWSNNKPYFEDVREEMARIVAAGLVPLKPDGNIDLDTVYDRALWGLPEVRAKVQADAQKKADDARAAKEAAEKKAQQDAAAKAKKAAVSLAGGAPGPNSGAQDKKKTKAKTVRESIAEARQQLADQE